MKNILLTLSLIIGFSFYCYGSELEFELPVGYGTKDVIYNKTQKTLTFKNAIDSCSGKGQSDDAYIGQFASPSGLCGILIRTPKATSKPIDVLSQDYTGTIASRDIDYNAKRKTLKLSNVTAYCSPVTPPGGTYVGQYVNPQYTAHSARLMGSQSKVCSIYYKPFVRGVTLPAGKLVSGVKTPINLSQDENETHYELPQIEG